ncbi:uncharacterized protein YfkK (UPF0435 family) [Planomicrobium koreense]|jgi:uncharacterized protein YfkK (UPF0435 family)|uniref:UPF0435 protein HNQ44_003274 n=1 Tax=Planococcus koreensis TaxID=112331 RepID=A0A7W8CUH0_9BACL|nr:MULTISPECIES: DUF1128 domain-containing protein [Planococcus]MBB5181800.1 uncharacterized protein YfkK (UPF0435 family) [Planococcus koreensis]MDN3450822.1 DUF1128 domain-containing protein [Planococcus sp. APC 3906]HSP21403.1 DUF1128 domain-containing protein [Planococcus sp. (in: firmicutes)]
MDLSKQSNENVSYMIEEIKTKLRMVNVDAMKPEHFNASQYEDLKELYEMVASRENITPNEMQAIAKELGSLRK